MQNLVVLFRELTAGATVLGGAQNISEFQSYLNEAYLSQGYTLKSEHLLRVQTEPAYSTDWAFYLVKDVEVTPSKAKTDK